MLKFLAYGKESEDVKHTSVTALDSDECNSKQTADEALHQNDFIYLCANYFCLQAVVKTIYEMFNSKVA